jgi:hypothetical protein
MDSNINTNSKTKERLRKKLLKKGKKLNKSPEDESETDLFNMLNQVNKMLKENPNMVKKVSKCVSSIFENKDLMSTLTNEIGSKINFDSENSELTQIVQDQTFVNNSEGDLVDASEKEDKQ